MPNKRKPDEPAIPSYRDLVAVVRKDSVEQSRKVDWLTAFQTLSLSERNNLLMKIVRRYKDDESSAHAILQALSTDETGVGYLKAFLGDCDSFVDAQNTRVLSLLDQDARKTMSHRRSLVLKKQCIPLLALNYGWEAWVKLPRVSDLSYEKRMELVNACGCQSLIAQAKAYITPATFKDSSYLGQMLVLTFMRQSTVSRSTSTHIPWIAGQRLCSVLSQAPDLLAAFKTWIRSDYQGRPERYMHENKCLLLLQRAVSVANLLDQQVWQDWFWNTDLFSLEQQRKASLLLRYGNITLLRNFENASDLKWEHYIGIMSGVSTDSAAPAGIQKWQFTNDFVRSRKKLEKHLLGTDKRNREVWQQWAQENPGLCEVFRKKLQRTNKDYLRERSDASATTVPATAFGDAADDVYRYQVLSVKNHAKSGKEQQSDEMQKLGRWADWVSVSGLSKREQRKRRYAVIKAYSTVAANQIEDWQSWVDAASDHNRDKRLATILKYRKMKVAGQISEGRWKNWLNASSTPIKRYGKLALMLKKHVSKVIVMVNWAAECTPDARAWRDDEGNGLLDYIIALKRTSAGHIADGIDLDHWRNHFNRPSEEDKKAILASGSYALLNGLMPGWLVWLRQDPRRYLTLLRMKCIEACKIIGRGCWDALVQEGGLLHANTVDVHHLILAAKNREFTRLLSVEHWQQWIDDHPGDIEALLKSSGGQANHVDYLTSEQWCQWAVGDMLSTDEKERSRRVGLILEFSCKDVQMAIALRGGDQQHRPNDKDAAERLAARYWCQWASMNPGMGRRILKHRRPAWITRHLTDAERQKLQLHSLSQSSAHSRSRIGARRRAPQVRASSSVSRHNRQVPPLSP